MYRTVLSAFLLAAASLAMPTIAIAAPVHPAFEVAVSGQARDQGPGRHIVLIPGLASSSEVWRDTAAHLCAPATGRQCHVLTLAGFAGTAPVEGDLLAQVESQLAAYISEQKMASPVIIGHSLGGFLGLKLAIDYPQQVGKLVVVDALPALGATQLASITPEQLQQMAAQMRSAMQAQDDATFADNARRSVASMASAPDDIARIASWGQRSSRSTVTDAMTSMMGQDLRQDVARIKAPVLVLGSWAAYKGYATRDAILQTFRTQYQQLPGVQIVLAESARHFIMYDERDWMLERIDTFLK